ncbi:hypothetical protein CBA19CS11_00110 [Caballeronia novacaledonica]|uniref:hypothetical protein n=1 Tax=Caballeronia novacaledonica TaxID=1544861 RepID=UPI001EE264BB|nr:hypothetical protein [Caballeronia novacaledonica]GJH07182.1 hypothetical protein CBA19CS11_00110 [Caballeronia novacaledonica]
MKFWLKALLLAVAFIALSKHAGAAPSTSTAQSIRTVQSSHPSYVARVAHGRLISISLQPQELKLDMNVANSIASETGDFKPARYSFPSAQVPQTLLSHLTEIYAYARRRDVPIVSSGGDWVVAEYFLAGSHIPVSRFELLGKRVRRQEQLDRTGRTVRTIIVGWTRASAMHDDESSDVSTLDEHPVWMRVFKVQPGGGKQLVALAWRKTRFSSTPDTYDAPNDNELAYGLPNGVVKWRTMEEFARAEHIDLDARSLDGNPRRQQARM